MWIFHIRKCIKDRSKISEAHRLLYHSSVGSILIKKKKRPEKALGLRSTNRSHASLRPPVARDHAPLADAADAGLFVDAATPSVTQVNRGSTVVWTRSESLNFRPERNEKEAGLWREFLPVYAFWFRPPVARDHAPLADAADAGLFVDAAGIAEIMCTKKQSVAQEAGVRRKFAHKHNARPRFLLIPV